MPNWHSGISSQTSSIDANDGVFFDFDRNGMFNGVGPVGSTYSPLASNTSEFFK